MRRRQAGSPAVDGQLAATPRNTHSTCAGGAKVAWADHSLDCPAPTDTEDIAYARSVA
jgi:hypothetical protein